MSIIRQELQNQMVAAYARLSEDSVREALGQWVSKDRA